MISSASAAAADRPSEPVRRSSWSGDDSGLSFADLFATHTSEDSPPCPARLEQRREEPDDPDPNWVGYDPVTARPDYQAPTSPPQAGKTMEEGKSRSVFTQDANMASGADLAPKLLNDTGPAPNAAEEAVNRQLADEVFCGANPIVDEVAATRLQTAEAVEPAEETGKTPETPSVRVSPIEISSRKREEKSVETDAPPDGTAVAPQEPTMNWAEQQDETAGQQQNIPDARVLDVRGAPRRTDGDERSPLEVWDLNQGDASNQPPGPTTDFQLESVDVAARVDLVERMESTIEVATSRLVRSTEHSVSVVLRPEPGTELRMHVRWAGDKIEAAVELQEGDTAVLRSAWPQLQQRLEKQGVHLSDLTSSGGFNDRSQEERRRPVLELPSPFDTCVPLTRHRPATSPVTSTPLTKMQFESWA